VRGEMEPGRGKWNSRWRVSLGHGAPHPRDAVPEPPLAPPSPAARHAGLPSDAVPEPPSPRCPQAGAAIPSRRRAGLPCASHRADARRPSRLASSPRHGGGSPERSCGGAGRKEEQPHERSCDGGVSGEEEEEGAADSARVFTAQRIYMDAVKKK
jgi:hypothetical protein